MSMRTLLALSVGIGNGKESTEGGGETSGEVGRDVDLLISRLLEVFLSLDDAAEVADKLLNPVPPREEMLAADEDAVMPPMGADAGVTWVSEDLMGAIRG